MAGAVDSVNLDLRSATHTGDGESDSLAYASESIGGGTQPNVEKDSGDVASEVLYHQ